ncbi:ADP-glyceromanno-heptose 6-epimerase [Helicobacter monodelphidis]|uniref:ADP-glyceromanno-heptose 6-epimerase n=1 Tax=Helicobacter sp. 15-1451 TaxID=2004995 RepID=UPI000DCB467C|nr:ADP-glyceromanno-heptose 6-epimerase [Helicobacter sp. 15-1451]RAX58013.1 ADP-glyceromanno-heptose 6-epimerase [Helicobacter sp. 15-1451]
MKYIDGTLSGKTIVVSGGAGFIGSNIAKHLAYHHQARVIVFDKFRNQPLEEYSASLGHFKNLIGFNGEVIVGDITNSNDLALLEPYPIDYIFHEAAISDTTMLDEELVMRTNCNAFLEILKLAQRKNARVIYASSAGVYGNSPAPNVVGEGEIPENIYGFSKLNMDKLAMHFAEENPKMTIIGLRYFNVYGAGEFYKGKTASMVLQLGLQALEHKKVRLFTDGNQLRDFVYIEDVIQANMKALEAKRSGVYNVGFGKARSYNEIVHLLKEYLGIHCKIKYIDNPYSFFQNHTCADIDSTMLDLGYKPRFSLEAGIKAYSREIKHIFKKEVH